MLPNTENAATSFRIRVCPYLPCKSPVGYQRGFFVKSIPDEAEARKCESFLYTISASADALISFRYLLPARLYAMSRVLSQLPMGEIATVTDVGYASVDDVSLHLFRRLAELGFIPGETVKVLRKSFGGEPIAVRVGNSTFALRKYEADQIRVDVVQQ